MIFQGSALAELGQGEEGIAQIRQGMAGFQATGAEGGWPHYLVMLAEAYRTVGQDEEGLTALAKALATVTRTEERYYEAELYRLYGELLLRNGETETERTGDQKILSDSPILRFPVASPEDSFLRAIDIARRQQAKSLELRAVTSLARLWQQQGKKDEARQMLAEISGWFTEGFETKDLREAKKLLEELAR
jgi:predicted ATPase